MISANPPQANGGGADRNAIPLYHFPAWTIESHRLLTMPVRTSALRTLGAQGNVFAIESVIDEIAFPPKSPNECIFARTTEIISADLTTPITPCQFGGTPDCEQCGCIASIGMAAVGHHKLFGPLTAGHVFMASDRFGKSWRRLRDVLSPEPVAHPVPNPFRIL